MSQHPSLKTDSVGIAHSSVWKRFERLKHLFEKGKWEEDRSIFGLPKIKNLKVKVKKEKPVEATEAEAAKGTAGAPGQEGASAESAPASAPKKEEAKK